MTDRNVTRAHRTDLAARPHADVLIIGGGINGVATFRDLALQGVDVALVERNDFISGASAGSSHMIHGGVRYLENGEFRLVHEAVRERNDLIGTAAHYVKPLQTTIPIHSAFSGLFSAPMRMLTHAPGKPTERGALLIKVGLTIYDSFSRNGGRVPRHEFHARKRSLRALPDLHPGVKCTATYWDAAIRDPERLGQDLIRDARAAGGDRARAVNYTSAVAVDGDTVVLEDGPTGRRIPFSAKVVINAAGPWADLVNDALGRETRYMAGTKGSHIVLDHPQLLDATGGRELFFENSDGRIVLIHPLKGRVLVGTTDLEHDIAEPATCTEEEIDYFIDLIAQVLPDIAVDRSQIVYRFSGVRPLPSHEDLPPGFVSRDYRVEHSDLATGGPRLITLVGGKWTTFRASAEHLTDDTLAELGRERAVTTRGLAIGGGRGYPTDERARQAWIERHDDGVGRERTGRLLERYGTLAAEVIDAIIDDDDDRPLATLPDFSTAELRHLARTEDVERLADILQRRTDLAFTGRLSREIFEEIADAITPVLGWDQSRVASEVARTMEQLSALHGWREAAAEDIPA
ncbi:glycerol-3-phosphate dehydrogenase/oxidase [Microbacterium aquimaris]|uniref:Glycerol-3-phosphate dehydrogenase/oxidase n=1 Tax=Microbacterium aquimaris TaxID=459816 RepID=A0ABU5N5V2_9MICO|nr:glycerol-3-phosphate dehydrogenase/oxidase [Microbacterium aquimaris]MDZ8161489.1 glycerol-3-phosphate dehydrogenase/oxidase [Microbacterium aquimaris]